MSSSKNLELKKTGFLSKSNSAFIEEMYLKFINKDVNININDYNIIAFLVLQNVINI